MTKNEHINKAIEHLEAATQMPERTAVKWFDSIGGPVMELAKKRAEEQGYDKYTDLYPSALGALRYNLIWSKTPEGFEYWNRVASCLLSGNYFAEDLITTAMDALAPQKTTEEWLSGFCEPLRTVALARMREGGLDSAHELHKSAADAIRWAFWWKETPEGDDFWHNVESFLAAGNNPK